MTRPILYSFRRCPYAIRARLALASARNTVELREVLLRDKAPEFLATSPTATVPCLKAGDLIIDESRDIMVWALQQNDPEGWLDMPDEGQTLIDDNDGWFKDALDLYKYHSRHPESDPVEQRDRASTFLRDLDARLSGQDWLFGNRPTMADMAVLPFVRQFAHVDLPWFNVQPWHGLIRWLEAFKASNRFTSIMTKYPKWVAGAPVTLFP